MWQEIQESSGEIFDIPETFDADEDDLSAEEKFNMYLNSNIEHV